MGHLASYRPPTQRHSCPSTDAPIHDARVFFCDATCFPFLVMLDLFFSSFASHAASSVCEHGPFETDDMKEGDGWTDGPRRHFVRLVF